MGEWSKRVGEVGENIVGEYFKLIGWDNAQSRFDIPCVRGDEHQQGKGPRRDHGIDYLFSYRSPLMDKVINNLVISVKYVADDYPDVPGAKFKEHFLELAQIIECFKKSPQRQATMEGQSGIRRSQEIGVLFWLSNGAPEDREIVSKLARVNLPAGCVYDTVYVVDNKRVAFVYNAMTFAKKEYPGAEVNFHYFETGKNMDPMTTEKNGSILPVEMINSSVIPLKIDMPDSSANVLMLFLIDPFSEENFKRLAGLAQKLSSGWANKILLCFPDYVALRHENTVKKVKAAFLDKKTTAILEVKSFSGDFRTLQG